MAQSRLTEWSNSGHSRERLIWHEKWTEKPVVGPWLLVFGQNQETLSLALGRRSSANTVAQSVLPTTKDEPPTTRSFTSFRMMPARLRRLAKQHHLLYNSTISCSFTGS